MFFISAISFGESYFRDEFQRNKFVFQILNIHNIPLIVDGGGTCSVSVFRFPIDLFVIFHFYLWKILKILRKIHDGRNTGHIPQ